MKPCFTRPKSVAMVLSLLLFSHCLQAVTPPMFSPSTNDDHPNTGLAAMLQDSRIRRHEIISQAFRILQTMETTPECHQVAARDLMNDCESLDNESMDPKNGNVLDNVKSLFAARLAVCELSGAHATVPRECNILVPSSHACIRSGLRSFFSRKEAISTQLCYPEATHTQFKRCLAALEARPQSWTSYSNARQNAVVMCQASKEAIREEKIRTNHENLGEIVAHFTSALQDSFRHVQPLFDELDKYRAKFRKTQEQFEQDIATSRDTTLSMFGTIINSFQNAFQVVQSLTGMAIQARELHSRALNETRNDSIALIKEIRADMIQQMQSHYNDIANELAKFRSEQATEMDSFQGSVVDLSQGLSDIQMDIHSLRSTIQYMQTNMKNIGPQVENLHSDLEHLGLQVKHIQNDFELLGPQAKEIQSVLGETKQALSVLAAFGGIITYPRLSIIATIGMLALWISNWKVAGYVTAIGSFYILLYSLNIPELSRTAYTHILAQFNNMWPIHQSALWAMLALGCIVISLSIWVGIESHYRFKYQDGQGEMGVIPSVEVPAFPEISPRPPRHSFTRIAQTLRFSSIPDYRPVDQQSMAPCIVEASVARPKHKQHYDTH